jgi:hypothetical protein
MSDQSHQTSEEETVVVPPVADPPEQPPAQPTAEETLRKENEELKAKAAASARENQLMREAEAARIKAEQESTKEPTDSDLRAAFPEWDTLTEFEKKIARDNLVTKGLASSAVKTTKELKDERAWNTSIELAVSSDPALQGKEQAFRLFANQTKYKGAPMELLVSAFLQKSPAESPRPTPKTGLETGSGGPRNEPKPKGLSSEELEALRKNDYRAYEKYIKTHPIEIDL